MGSNPSQKAYFYYLNLWQVVNPFPNHYQQSLQRLIKFDVLFLSQIRDTIDTFRLTGTANAVTELISYNIKSYFNNTLVALSFAEMENAKKCSTC